MRVFDAIVIGTSAGGLNALTKILSALDSDFSIPIIIVQHMSPDKENYTASLLNRVSNLTVKEADEKEIPEAGKAYLAPPNYHVLIDRDGTLSLSIDEKVNYSRPSIDLLFESAAEVYKEKLLALVLTGANNDGTKGAERILAFGGTLVVEDPDSAESPFMPRSVINHCKVDVILQVNEIADYLNKINKGM